MLNYYWKEEQEKNWILEETYFDDRHQGKCESIMALGNGYLGLRSSVEEPYIGQTRNLFVAGTYNKFDENEVTELPNAADIIEMLIDINGELFSLKNGKIHHYSRRLNLKAGELIREVLWENSTGERYHIIFRRFVSLADMHLIGMKLEITALTADAEVILRTGINGRQTNSGVQHFHDGDKRVYENQFMQLVQRTTQSKIDFVLNSTVKMYMDREKVECKTSYFLERRRIHFNGQMPLKKGQTLAIEKISNIFTSLDNDIEIDGDLEELKTISSEHIKKNSKFAYDELFEKSKDQWNLYWKEAMIEIQADDDFDLLAVRFAQYHLLIMTPFHDERFSIGAKALTGEGYKGHVFWDTEIFILPYFQYSFPGVARQLLRYRFHTIEGARNKAKKFGYEGAMYPWETAFTGEEETPEWAAINIMTGKATKVWSGLKEHHITADIAYAVWNYYLSTNDEVFMDLYGSEIIFECAAFWHSRLEWNEGKHRYHINDVIGPDEYTEHIDNNAYTNYMAHFTIKAAIELYDSAIHKQWDNFKCLREKLRLKEKIETYKTLLDSIYLPDPNEAGIIPQDDTFLTKASINIEKYRDSHEKQRILKDYTREQVVNLQVLKQADVVMLLFVLRGSFDETVKRANWEYYEKRTIHDSSLSAAVHSIIANDFNEYEDAYRFFRKAAEIDLGQNPVSSNDGIHAASLGGIWLTVVMGFGGVMNDNGILHIHPKLPKTWRKLSFSLYWKGERINLSITKENVEVRKESEREMDLFIMGKRYILFKELKINDR
ncbi:hypothetical glycosyl hydrolase [Geosporobacter subterraneus DSM 17957]|uniref:Hypothetical glycosyl hydrolase n=1 Tax=Geosporobacter subterraneus DSM 17957 TaxID=1121919 RepID=A0A1M6MMT7_9FIRM|nr:glycosyl hydrolase family 65 protein [Geosporobacter subterraneus]SHJ84759.1 hypothetical glycosyl hydrolase [Geosporobacter subterraneus DSM 17957]